jgi:hypothetical protein
LVDCVTDYYGCEGGNYPLSFNYIGANGQELESSYPYMNDQTACTYDVSLAVAGLVQSDDTTDYFGNISDYYNEVYSTPEEIMEVVAAQPAAVLLNASGFKF